MSYAKEYEMDIQRLKEKLKHLIEQQKEENRVASECDEWAEKFRNYINVDKLTREMVLELIERIEVNEDSSIRIFYKFRNPYEDS